MNNVTNLEDFRTIKNLQKNIAMFESILTRTELEDVEEYKKNATELIRLKAKLKIAKLPKEY